MYESILCPIDGSDVSQSALESAIQHAERFGAELHVIHVVPYSNVNAFPEMGFNPSAAEHFAIEEELEDGGLLEQAREEAEAQGVPVKLSKKTGSPHREIIQYANENNIELLIMGTHGRSGVSRLFAGSVTEQVIRGTEVPVLAIN